MRIFYIYNINDYFCSAYGECPYKLYKMLEDGYRMSKYNKKLSYHSYDQILNRFNKLFVNNYLHANNKLDAYYCHKNNLHMITSNHEYSKLMVNSYSLKLKTNIAYPKFFNQIRTYSDNIFICDFENKDYFWLNKIISNQKDYIKE